IWTEIDAGAQIGNLVGGKIALTAVQRAELEIETRRLFRETAHRSADIGLGVAAERPLIIGVGADAELGRIGQTVAREAADERGRVILQPGIGVSAVDREGEPARRAQGGRELGALALRLAAVEVDPEIIDLAEDLNVLPVD